MKASSHDSELAEELRRQTALTPRVRGGRSRLLKGDA